MRSLTLDTRPWLVAPKPWRRPSITVAATVPGVWRRSRAGRDSQQLPPLSFSTDPSSIDFEELTDLFSQLARHAPTQAFHNSQTGSGSSRSGGDGSSGAGREGAVPLDCSAGRRLLLARVRQAVHRSHMCVAAFTAEQYLPEHQRLATRGLIEDPSSEERDATAAGSWWRPAARPRRVLVGFARAVTDGALVGTVHDLCVLPELQGRGLGRQLLDRLTKQLWHEDIVDVGLLAPNATVAFFEACSFGPDPEGSTTMALSAEGMRRWRRPGAWEFRPRPQLRELLLAAASAPQAAAAARPQL